MKIFTSVLFAVSLMTAAALAWSGDGSGYCSGHGVFAFCDAKTGEVTCEDGWKGSKCSRKVDLSGGGDREAFGSGEPQRALEGKLFSLADQASVSFRQIRQVASEVLL